MQGMANPIRVMGWSFVLCAVACGAVKGAAGVAPAGDDDPIVTIYLKPTAKAPDYQVCVRDVAAIEGGQSKLRGIIGELDLADLSGADKVIDIGREQIAFRLRLAGLEPQQFRFQGADHVRVQMASQRISEEELLATARKALLEHLTFAPEDLSIELLQPVIGPSLPLGARADIRLEAQLHVAGPPVGRVHVDVVVFVNGERRSAVPVLFEVRVSRRVASTTRRIERGELIGPKNTHFERRALDELHGPITNQDALAGKQANRTLAPGQVLTEGDLEPALSQNPVLVKQGSGVRLVTRVGSLQITTVGEALQDGRAGQMIRVRNVDSKNLVIGRVVDRTLVEVSFRGNEQ